MFTKGLKVVIACKPGYNTARIRYRICKFKQSLTCGNAILNDIGFQSGNGIGEILHCSAERNELFSEIVHIVLSGEEADNTATIRNSACHLRKCFTSGSRFCNNTGVNSSNFVCKVTHGATKWNKLFAERIHVVFSGKETNNATGIRKRISHLCKSLTCDCSIRNCFSIDTADFIRELFHGFSERNHLFSKAGKRASAGEPRGQSIQNICGCQDKNRFCKSLDAVQHSRIYRSRTVKERLNIGHETGKVRTNLRELTGYATHKAADDTANKLTDCRANSLKQIASFVDKPVQARNLRQSADRSEYKSKFSDDSTHTENAQHCTWNKSSHCTQSRHNRCKQTDTDDSLKKSFCIDTLKRVYNT